MIIDWVMVVIDGSYNNVLSLPKVWSKPVTNMAWYGTMCHSRPVDQFKPYYVFGESTRSSPNYDMMPVGFNALAKC